MRNILYIQGTGEKNNFSAIFTDLIPNFHLISSGKALPEFFGEDSFGKIDNLSKEASTKLGLKTEDMIYYVYAVFHHPVYLKTYNNDLKKGFPHIPLLEEKEKYVEIGRKLTSLHLDYENQPIWRGVEIIKNNSTPSFKVKKMKHPKKGATDSIIFNEHITIDNIPKKAYEYVVSGRPAIEWIIEQYRIKVDKKSGIIDDPNEFSNDPQYILKLLLSVITVSMKTIDFIEELPEFNVLE